MKVADARARIGKQVHVLTFRGNYIGTILSIYEDVRPFKARIRLERLTEWPTTSYDGRTEQVPYPKDSVKVISAIEIEDLESAMSNPYGGNWIREAYGTPSWVESVHLAHRRRVTLIDHETTPRRIERIRDLYSYLAQVCDEEKNAARIGRTA
jgi:hypothetical protein